MSSFYLAVVFVLALISNTGVLLLYYKVKKLRNNFNLLLMSLLVGELVTAITGIPVEFVAALRFEQKNSIAEIFLFINCRGGWDLGEFPCISLGFMMTFLGNSTAFREALC